MRINSYELAVRVRGRPVDEYIDSDKSIWIEGRVGSEYDIWFRNNTSTAVKAVFSVDGLNVMNAKREWTRGYVVEPYSTLIVPGWRRDSKEVASFYFSSIDRSYAKRIGSGVDNIGVIGCRVFQKRPDRYHVTYGNPDWWNARWTYNGRGPTTAVYPHMVGSLSSSSMSLNAGNFAAGATPAPDHSVGTGWGQKKDFKTKEVSFEANDWASAEFAIFYDSAKGLADRGIYVKNRDRVGRPNPFPTDGCPEPK